MKPIKIRLFKNNYKEQGDNKPNYQNKNIAYPEATLQEDIVLRKGSSIGAALWKNDDGSLYVQIAENQSANTQTTNTAPKIDQSKIMGTPEYQKAQMSNAQEEEDIPF
tara:strand:+ start:20910 stop:21233 length:324 start_codon:yes stop_codon:yes gene_type:complete